MSETHDLAPLNRYASSKYLMEEAVQGFLDDHAVHCCLRLANVVGADSLAPGLSQDHPIRLDRFKNGSGPVRSYIAPNHLLRILVGLAGLPPDSIPPVLNVAAIDPVGMEDLARACHKQIEWCPAPATATQEVSLDTQALSILLPDLDLQCSADEMIADWNSVRRA